MNYDIEKRLLKLENSNKRSKLVMSVLSVLILLLLVSGFSPNSSYENIKAKSLDIVNDNGKTVLHLGVRSSGAGGFWITDKNGNRVTKLNQDINGGRISIINKEGKEAATLLIDENGNGKLITQ